VDSIQEQKEQGFHLQTGHVSPRRSHETVAADQNWEGHDVLEYGTSGELISFAP